MYEYLVVESPDEAENTKIGMLQITQMPLSSSLVNTISHFLVFYLSRKVDQKESFFYGSSPVQTNVVSSLIMLIKSCNVRLNLILTIRRCKGEPKEKQV